MTLKELMDNKFANRKSIATGIMIKILARYEELTSKERDIIYLYSPENIHLYNLNPENLENLESLVIKFTSPIINKNHKYDRLFLAPEIHKGEGIKVTIKSIVFSLGVIWDLFIHE